MSDKPARLRLFWGCPVCSKEGNFTYDPRIAPVYLADVIEHNHKTVDKNCTAKKYELVVLDIEYCVKDPQQ